MLLLVLKLIFAEVCVRPHPQNPRNPRKSAKWLWWLIRELSDHPRYFRRISAKIPRALDEAPESVSKATPNFNVQRFTERTKALRRFKSTLTYGPEGQPPIGVLDHVDRFIREYDAEHRLRSALAA